MFSGLVLLLSLLLSSSCLFLYNITPPQFGISIFYVGVHTLSSSMFSLLHLLNSLSLHMFVLIKNTVIILHECVDVACATGGQGKPLKAQCYHLLHPLDHAWYMAWDTDICTGG